MQRKHVVEGKLPLFRIGVMHAVDHVYRLSNDVNEMRQIREATTQVFIFGVQGKGVQVNTRLSSGSISCAVF